MKKTRNYRGELEGYHGLATAVLERARLDWQGVYDVIKVKEYGTPIRKEDLWEFIQSDRFELFISMVNVKLGRDVPLEQDRARYIKNLGEYKQR